MEKSNKSFLISTIVSGLTFTISVVFLIYTLVFCGKQINQTFLIISSLILCLTSISLLMTSLFKQKKFHNILFSISSFLVFIFIGFNLLVLTNTIKLNTLVTLKSFYNTNINDVLLWGEKNNITINQLYEYSDTIPEYNIISQDIAAGTLLKDIKEINVLVSSGPSLDKKFILQSLIGMNIDDAMEIINKNFMSNVKINYELNDTYARDIIIEQSISGEIRRSYELTLLVSLGKESDLVPVELIDFKGKSLNEADLWLKRNGIKYEIAYEFSDTISRNYCVSQSEKAGTVIDPKTNTITLIVSKGKEINIPDFTTMSVNEVTSWVSEHKLKLTFKEAYDNEIEEGKIISSSAAINTKLEEGAIVEITVSKGKLKMEQFDSIGAFRSWANSLGLQYEENAEFSDKLNGEIISTTPGIGEVINIKDTIHVTYSKGKSTTVPNFYNKSKNEASTLCDNYALDCYFSYRYSSDVDAGYIMYQTMSSGSEVAEYTSMTLYISSGPEPEPEPVYTCTSTETHTLIIQPAWVGGSANATIATLREKLSSKYPNVTFYFTTRAGNRSSGYIHSDSPITSGSTIQDCQEYTIIINE